MSEFTGGDAAKAKSAKELGRFLPMLGRVAAAFVSITLINVLPLYVLSSSNAWYVHWIPSFCGAAAAALPAALAFSTTKSEKEKTMSHIAWIILDFMVAFPLWLLVDYAAICRPSSC